MSQELRRRNEIAPADTWDAHSVFSDDAAWEAAIVNVQADLKTLHTFAGRLHEGPAVMLAALNQLEWVVRGIGKIFVYASMHWTVDTAAAQATAMMGRARGLLGKVQAATSFIDPELLALEESVVQNWMAEEPELAIYAHYYDSLSRRRDHVRSAEVEELLGQLSDPFRTAAMTHSILADADLTFDPAGESEETRPVSQGTIGALLTDADRTIRRTAFENYADAFLAHKHSMANNMAAGVKQDVFRAQARRYPSALAAALGPNQIPEAVFHQTIATFQKHLPVWHRYWRVRQRALGYDELHVYDIKAPLTAEKPVISFDQAFDWVEAGMAPLGAEYVQAMAHGVREQRWVDIYPSKGKRSGAFSSGVQGTYPFILMNFTDDVFSMSTLAHELGHSMHSYLTWKTQPNIYSRYSLFVAEVASNFNQALVRDHLLNTLDDVQLQIAILEEAMSNFHRYFFIMPTLARFELTIHEQEERGEGLTAESLINLMADLFGEGYGPDMVVDRERVGITWAQFATHLYSNFYVYQYTTGISAAHALAGRVVSGEEGAVDDYLNFLRTGAADYPINALLQAGVDMTTSAPMEAAFAVLSGYVDRLEALLN